MLLIGLIVFGALFKSYKKFFLVAFPVVLIAVVVLIEAYVKPWQVQVQERPDPVIPEFVYISKFIIWFLMAHIGFWGRKLYTRFFIKISRNEAD